MDNKVQDLVMGILNRLRNLFYSSQLLNFWGRRDDLQFKLKSLDHYECSHKQPRLPAVIRDEKCITCSTSQCYICTENHHLSNACKVKLSTLLYPQIPMYNNRMHVDTLRKFNFGQVGKLDLRGLKCLCGKPWGPGSSICSACGMVSCSKECHHVWEGKGYCNFNTLFRKEHNQKFDMRSILYQNIQYALDSKLSPGTQLNNNKSKFITCFSSQIPTQVYLQRGYRIYGHPNQSLLDQLTIVPKNIDYYLHLDRICDCQCDQCVKEYHSVGMCTSKCMEGSIERLREGLENKENEVVCECECELCSSGEILKTQSHTRYDCLLECQEREEEGGDQGDEGRESKGKD